VRIEAVRIEGGPVPGCRLGDLDPVLGRVRCVVATAAGQIEAMVPFG